MYIKGLETDTKLWGTPSPSLIQMLGGTTVSALLAKMEQQNPVYYHLSQLSVEPAPGTFWMCIDRALRHLCGSETFPWNLHTFTSDLFKR
jgi:hypothetical protein